MRVGPSLQHVIQPNDVIFAINGQRVDDDHEVNDHSDLPAKIGKLPRPITITFMRRAPSDASVVPGDDQTMPPFDGISRSCLTLSQAD